MAMQIHTRNPCFKIRFVTRRLGEFGFESTQDSAVDIQIDRRLGYAAGSFQLSFVPRALSNILNSEGWEDAFDPMDYVEIWVWVPPRLPRIILRGWVDHIGEQFRIAGGRPNRIVTVSGRDYGKILLNTKLYWVDNESTTTIRVLEEIRLGMLELSGWGTATTLPEPEAPPLAAGQRSGGTELTPTQVLEIIHRRFYQPAEAEVLAQFLGNTLPTLGLSLNPDGWESGLKCYTPAFFQKAMAPFTDIWSLMYAFQHRPWRELFIHEAIDGPILRYRPAPWLDRDGAIVQRLTATGPLGEGSEESPWPVPDTDLVSYELSRSDAQMVNWFLTYPEIAASYLQFSKQVGQELEGIFAPDNPFVIGRDGGTGGPLGAGEPTRADYRRFGFRVGEFASPFIDFERRLERGTLQSRMAEVRELGTEGNRRLVKAHDHSHLLEYGRIIIKGDERIQQGDYVQLTDRGRPGTNPPRYYVEGIGQDYRHGTQEGDGHYLTHLEVSRGRGHLNAKYELPG